MTQIVKYLKIIAVASASACAALLIGDKTLVHRQELGEKRLSLEQENQVLATEIRTLERSVTLLRSDSRTIEKVAKRKLGMAGPDETVYIFDDTGRGDARDSTGDTGLSTDHNIP